MVHDIILVLCLSTKFNEKENNFFFPKLCINSFHLLAVVETLNTQIWERSSRKYAGILWKWVTKILESQSNYSTHMYIIIGENRSSSINHRVTLMNCWNRLWLMSFLSPTCFASEGRYTPSWHSVLSPALPGLQEVGGDYLRRGQLAQCLGSCESSFHSKELPPCRASISMSQSMNLREKKLKD